MKVKNAIVAGWLLLIAAPGHSQVENGAYRALLNVLLDHSVPELTVHEAAASASAYVFLDAREWREYEVSHIAQAKWVGYKTFELLQLQQLPKDTPIVVYCSVGYRSEKIAEQLIRAGFRKIWNLYGGIFEWVNAGYPVYNTNGPTEEVHAYDRKWGVWLKRGKKVYGN
ncbi:MAG: rhodanese-like domain-containing protein [Saprospiraceae bacterium]|nr:rhodanese-like domain-containing protein [Saprospiraceae bacterium]MDW8483128.1 rhodanese-like domain-containing protein [Saprospiraceae bacterium]